MKNGPVHAGFTIYEDFLNYQEGIYHKTTDKMIGGHAAKVIGFGNENGVGYWICANSWGT
jgi:cathepsin B